jgi:hypothetical protein
MVVSNTMSRAPAHAAAPRVSHNWWVQLGVFRSKRAARAEVEMAARHYRALGDAEGSVDGGRRSYRARFTGLSEISAHQACSTLKARGHTCEAGGPA